MKTPMITKPEKKHIQDAWIWAATIIALGMLCTVDVMFVQVSSQGSKDIGLSYSP
jgi:hypothetical protein